MMPIIDIITIFEIIKRGKALLEGVRWVSDF